MLGTSSRALQVEHDLVMLDLDGVVYVGAEAVPGAAEAVEAARAAGAHVAFITNNAARPPAVVAEHLTGLGVRAAPEDVVTSAQAAARVLREQHGEGAVVWVLGARGLREAVGDAGLVAADGRVGHEEAPDPVALVTGYDPDVRWSELMRAAVRVASGLPWVACNTDHSLPTPEGRAPGHGVLVRMLADFTGVQPVVAGKPERPLLDETVRRVGGTRPLMVGDRLDTDIEGASRVGMASLLVLTGVTGLAELVAAPPGVRPTYLSWDLAGLGEQHAAPVAHGHRWTAGPWTARVEGGRLRVEATGAEENRHDDWWRAVACAAWEHLDTTGAPADVSSLRPPEARAGGGGR